MWAPARKVRIARSSSARSPFCTCRGAFPGRCTGSESNIDTFQFSLFAPKTGRDPRTPNNGSIRSPPKKIFVSPTNLCWGVRGGWSRSRKTLNEGVYIGLRPGSSAGKRTAARGDAPGRRTAGRGQVSAGKRAATSAGAGGDV